MDAQSMYAEHRVSDVRFTKMARLPSPDEPMESGFRPIDPKLDNFEASGVRDAPWPEDRTVLYWWRATFWRLRDDDSSPTDLAPDG